MSNVPQNTNSNPPISGSPAPTATPSNASSQSPPKADRKWELERQLHEQYASNSNSHIKSFITFSTALFALFGFYGYLYAHTTDEFSRRVVQIILPSGNADVSVGVSPLYSLQSFILLALVVVVIFCFLTSLCIYLGYAERRDQIQLRLIRDECDFKTVYLDPRDRCYMHYLASYYRFFYNVLIISQVFVIASAAIKCPPQCSGFTLFIYILMTIFLVGSIHVKMKYFMKYKRLNALFPKPKSSKKCVKCCCGSNGKYVCKTDGDDVWYEKAGVNKTQSDSSAENTNNEEQCGECTANWFQYYWNHRCCVAKYLFRFAFDLVLLAIVFCIPLLAGAVTL